MKQNLKESNRETDKFLHKIQVPFILIMREKPEVIQCMEEAVIGLKKQKLRLRRRLSR